MASLLAAAAVATNVTAAFAANFDGTAAQDGSAAEIVSTDAAAESTESPKLTYGDFDYTVNSDGTGVTITDCSYLVFGAVEIPAEINGLPVVDIDPMVFYFLDGVMEINVESGNANYSSDAGVLYNKDKKALALFRRSGANGAFAQADVPKELFESRH